MRYNCLACWSQIIGQTAGWLEWFKAPASKAGVPARVPRVRIPHLSIVTSRYADVIFSCINRVRSASWFGSERLKGSHLLKRTPGFFFG